MWLAGLMAALALCGYRNWVEAVHETQVLVHGHAVYATGIVMTSDDAKNFGNFISIPDFTIPNDDALQPYADLKGRAILEYRPHIVQHMGKVSSLSENPFKQTEKVFWHSRSFERYRKIPIFGKEPRVFTLRDRKEFIL